MMLPSDVRAGAMAMALAAGHEESDRFKFLRFMPRVKRHRCPLEKRKTQARARARSRVAHESRRINMRRNRGL